MKQNHSTQIAVIGSGISGLTAAYHLAQNGFAVSLFEANAYFGGHTRTIDIAVDNTHFAIDTGFLVFNHKTYPLLCKLFAELEILTNPAEMSFSASVGEHDKLEWSGHNLFTVFADYKQLLNKSLWLMLKDVLVFNRQIRALIQKNHLTNDLTLEQFLTANHYSQSFCDYYLMPMIGSIWSCSPNEMRHFPLKSIAHFLDNHGLLQIFNRPQWYSVQSGARQYVEKMLAKIPHHYNNTRVHKIMREHDGTQQKIRIFFANHNQVFDHVILACHANQSVELLGEYIQPIEKQYLAPIRYQKNLALTHTDASVLPKRKAHWAAWNYQVSNKFDEKKVCLHYLINKLQILPVNSPVIVSLNPSDSIEPQKILDRFEFDHPIFDQHLLTAQNNLASLQGLNNTWYCGAWCGYGFHEDGTRSGEQVADSIKMRFNQLNNA